MFKIWNVRKDKRRNKGSSDDKLIDGNPAEHDGLIAKIQKRVGVSRSEAKRIIRNSEFMS